MANENKVDASEALCRAFLEYAVTGVEDWQKISLSKLGQLKVPYGSCGAKRLKDFVAECTEVAGIRGKTVYLRAEGVKRVEVALASSQRSDEVGAFGSIAGGEPRAADGRVEPEDTQISLAMRLLKSPLAVGSITLREVDDGGDEHSEAVLCLVLRAWTSYPPHETEGLNAGGVDELLEELPQLGRQAMAITLMHAVRHVRKWTKNHPQPVGKLAHNLDAEFREIASRIRLGEPPQGYRSAKSRLDGLATRVGKLREGLVNAIQDFCAESSLSGAGELSVGLDKAAKAYLPFALPEEREAIDTRLANPKWVVGRPLRRFVNACAAHETTSVIREAEQIRAAVSDLEDIVASSVETDAVSTFVAPLVAQVKAIVDEGTADVAALAQPDIVLLDDEVKVDLGSTAVSFLVKIRNDGRGRASNVLTELAEESPFSLTAVREPGSSTNGAVPFDLVDRAERIVEVVLQREQDVRDRAELTLRWKCGTASGRTATFSGKLVVRQQRMSPDWESLKRRPPYTPRTPIQDPGKLFGRNKDLEELCRNARTQQSTFISGQKRVGKTSVLNVVQSLLTKEEDMVVAFLRRGEIQDKDQGGIAYRIAKRLTANAALLSSGSSTVPAVPDESHFGVFLGDGLVDFFEQLKACRPNATFLVMFDEFEEINDALFVGHNVKRFVAGIRSLTELGLTFFLAGSERIRSIKGLSTDFNHWGLLDLKRIKSLPDLRSLIEEPVSVAIEFTRPAVDRVVEYFQGNPFYTVLLCDYIFQQCEAQRKTHVSKTYVDSVIDEWLRERLLMDNFSHFWEDEPALDPKTRMRHQAESALAIACVSALGGRYTDVSEVVEAQDEFRLADHQVPSFRDMRNVLMRLQKRQVLKNAKEGKGYTESGHFDLEVFRDWMAVSDARRELVDRWRQFRPAPGRGTALAGTPSRPSARSGGAREGWKLPVHDADIHQVSQLLRGTDVTSETLKEWLRQFNEDETVLVAWKLVKRLAESGYMGSSYQRELAKQVCQGMEARRSLISSSTGWMYGPGRRRKVNLCLVWLDDGAAQPARWIQETIKPGMKTRELGRVATWVQQRKDFAQDDPILALVDDFAGTGGKLLGGLEQLNERLQGNFQRLVEGGRVICCVLAAFPEAEQAVQKKHPEICVVAGKELNSDLRAIDPEAGIFESTKELDYARRVVHAIGTEIMPSMPLGYGGMGGLVALGNRCPNNSLPHFWSNGTDERPWIPLFQRP